MGTLKLKLLLTFKDFTPQKSYNIEPWPNIFLNIVRNLRIFVIG